MLCTRCNLGAGGFVGTLVPACAESFRPRSNSSFCSEEARWLRVLDGAPDLSVGLWLLLELMVHEDCRIQLN